MVSQKIASGNEQVFRQIIKIKPAPFAAFFRFRQVRRGVDRAFGYQLDGNVMFVFCGKNVVGDTGDFDGVRGYFQALMNLLANCLEIRPLVT